jgi:uncharacterized membrane protein YhaH (DUF805 family)
MSERTLFTGRINRKYYALSWLILMAALTPVAILTALLLPYGWTLAVAVALAAIVTVFGFSIQIRRLHDVDLSGLWVVAFVVIIIVCDIVNLYGGSILSLISSLLNLGLNLAFFLWPGSGGANNYGPSNQYKNLKEAIFPGF